MKLFSEYGLPWGENLGDKGYYMENQNRNKNIVIYNATILNNREIVWTGDLDLTETSQRIDTISSLLGMELVVETEFFKEIYSTTTKFLPNIINYVHLVNGKYYQI